MKISNWKRLSWINHYHQPAGRQPNPLPLPPYHERVEVMTGGRGWIRHEGEWREVSAGDIIWNKPSDLTIGRSDPDNPYHCLAVTLVSRTRKGSDVPRFSRWPDIGGVRAFTREVARLFLDDGFDRQALFEHVAGQLLFRVRLHLHRPERSDLPPQIVQVVKEIEKNYASPCRLDELAAMVGWSVAHLHQVFREKLNTTPHRMIIRLRLRAARERLVSTNQPVKQIAFECGFLDAAAFVHAFKAGTGMTPGQYRARSL